MTATYVQAVQTSGGNVSDSTVLSPSVTVTTGNALAVLVAYTNASQQTITLSDPSSNTYTAIGSQVAIGTDRFAIFRCMSITGFTSGQITATFGGASTFRSILVVEVSGATSFDAGNLVSQASPGTGSNAITVSATAGQTSGLIVGFTVDDSASNRVPTAGTGFTDRGTWFPYGGSQDTSRLETKAYAASGSTAATFTANASGGSDSYANAIWLFADSAGGGGTVVNPLSGRGGSAARPLVN